MTEPGPTTTKPQEWRILFQTIRKVPSDAVFRFAVQLKNAKREGLPCVWQSAGMTELGEEAWIRQPPHSIPWALLEQFADHIIALTPPAPTEPNGALTNRIEAVA